MIKFINDEHKERFNKCIEQDGTYLTLEELIEQDKNLKYI